MLYLGAKKSLLSSGKTLAQQVAAMFASGEQGAWYDPSDLSTLFQDSAGTTPVTAVGQPVGLMLDKSGRGNAAQQVTAINRPVLQQDAFGKYHLALNGTNSWMYTPDMPLSAQHFYSFGVASDAEVTYSGLFEMIRTGGVISTATSADSILQDYVGIQAGQFRNRSTAQRYPATLALGDAPGRVKPAPFKRISWANLGGTYSNGDLYTGSTASSVDYGIRTIVTGTGVIHLMRGYAGNYFAGRFYGAVMRMAATPLEAQQKVNQLLNSKTGAY